jgi:RND family efflux transporter MFP subunit
MKMPYFNRMMTTLLVLTICSVSSLTALSADEEKTDEDQGIVSVTVKPLATLTFPAKYTAPAVLLAKNHTTLSTELGGKVKQVNVDVGDLVKEGQVLVELDCRDYVYAQQQLASALDAKETQLKFAEKVFKRNKGLLKKSTIAEQSYEQAETNYLASKADLKTTQAQLQTANLNVERCKVKAPFSGQITQRQVQLGQWVATATPLFHLLQTEKLEVSARLSTAQTQTLKQAENIHFSANNISIQVVVRAIIASINDVDRTQEVRLKLSTDSVSKFSTGLPGRLSWNLSKRLLPAEYLTERDGQYGVLYLQDGKVAFHALPSATEGQPNAIDLPEQTKIFDKNRAGLILGQSIQLEGNGQ